jgi:CheY-like chemotaxis protein
MTILFIEDDENKRDRILSFVSERFHKIQVDEAKSLQGGVKRLKQSEYELIILDMTLPNFDVGPDEPVGGVTHSFGGREFLKQVLRLGINTPVVVLTQFESFGRSGHEIGLSELDSQLRQKFGEVYLGAVYYHPSIDDWKDRLSEIIMTNANMK